MFPCFRAEAEKRFTLLTIPKKAAIPSMLLLLPLYLLMNFHPIVTHLLSFVLCVLLRRVLPLGEIRITIFHVIHCFGNGCLILTLGAMNFC